MALSRLGLQPLPVNFVHAEWITLHDNRGFRAFVDFLRAEFQGRACLV
jgi:hypothetical protein